MRRKIYMAHHYDSGNHTAYSNARRAIEGSMPSEADDKEIEQVLKSFREKGSITLYYEGELFGDVITDFLY